MNSDDVAASRRRHRFQAAVPSAVIIAPPSSWNCQHSNDQFTYLGDSAHSLVGILRWEPLPFVRSRHPTAHSWWFGTSIRIPFRIREPQGLRPISGHIGHWAGDLCPSTTTGRRADDLYRPGCCRRAGPLDSGCQCHRRSSSTVWLRLGGEVARDGAQWSRPLLRYRLNPPRAQRLRAVRVARWNGPSMPA